MPDQIKGVQVTVNPDGTTCNIQVGPNGYENVLISSLFDRSNFDPDHLLANIRLRRVIGGYSVLWSQEFTDAINENGVRLSSGDYYNVQFSVNQDGSYNLDFGNSVGSPPNQGITVDPDTLAQDTHDIEVVMKNVKSFLRIAGYTDLVTPAVNGIYAGKTGPQAVALWTFRY